MVGTWVLRNETAKNGAEELYMLRLDSKTRKTLVCRAHDSTGQKLLTQGVIDATADGTKIVFFNKFNSKLFHFRRLSAFGNFTPQWLSVPHPEGSTCVHAQVDLSHDGKHVLLYRMFKETPDEARITLIRLEDDVEPTGKVWPKYDKSGEFSFIWEGDSPEFGGKAAEARFVGHSDEWILLQNRPRDGFVQCKVIHIATASCGEFHVRADRTFECHSIAFNHQSSHKFAVNQGNKIEFYSIIHLESQMPQFEKSDEMQFKAPNDSHEGFQFGMLSDNDKAAWFAHCAPKQKEDDMHFEVQFFMVDQETRCGAVLPVPHELTKPHAEALLSMMHHHLTFNKKTIYELWNVMTKVRGITVFLGGRC